MVLDPPLTPPRLCSTTAIRLSSLSFFRLRFMARVLAVEGTCPKKISRQTCWLNRHWRIAARIWRSRSFSEGRSSSSCLREYLRRTGSAPGALWLCSMEVSIESFPISVMKGAASGLCSVVFVWRRVTRLVTESSARSWLSTGVCIGFSPQFMVCLRLRSDGSPSIASSFRWERPVPLAVLQRLRSRCSDTPAPPRQRVFRTASD